MVSKYLFILLIDTKGVIKVKKLEVKQVWSLDKEKVMVELNSQGHPVRDGRGLFFFTSY